MTRKTTISMVLLGALAASAPGCSILAALDEPGGVLPACEDGDVQSQRDLVLVMDSLTPHIGNYGEIVAVSEGGFVSVRAVLDPVVSRDMTVSLRDALPAGPFRLDVFFDYNINRVYDPPPTDHAWTLDSCASGVYRFSHNPAFENIGDPAAVDVGEDFLIHFESFTPHLGQLVEVRVVDLDAALPRTVGYYRLAEAESEAFTLGIPGIIEPGTRYTIAIWADKNADLTYQAPDVDHSWRVDATGEATGLEMTFVHNTNFAPIDDLL